MGRYVVLLMVPVLIGVLIAAGVILIAGLRERRSDARGPALEAPRSERPSSTADRPAGEPPADVRRRIAS